ncbi:MAG: ester cyclase [Chloroflexi bacterium]|nr:ester cyclase [Chloroflexota bacterium]
MSGPGDRAERNRELLAAHFDKLNRGGWQAAAEDFSADARNFGRPVSRDRIRRVLEDVYATFPDWRMEIVELLAEEDRVAIRCRVSGTHRGVGELPVNRGDARGRRANGQAVRGRAHPVVRAAEWGDRRSLRRP